MKFFVQYGPDNFCIYKSSNGRMVVIWKFQLMGPNGSWLKMEMDRHTTTYSSTSCMCVVSNVSLHFPSSFVLIHFKLQYYQFCPTWRPLLMFQSWMQSWPARFWFNFPIWFRSSCLFIFPSLLSKSNYSFPRNPLVQKHLCHEPAIFMLRNAAKIRILVTDTRPDSGPRLCRNDGKQSIFSKGNVIF